MQSAVICWQICAVCCSSLHAGCCLCVPFRGLLTAGGATGDTATQWWPENRTTVVTFSVRALSCFPVRAPASNRPVLRFCGRHKAPRKSASARRDEKRERGNEREGTRVSEKETEEIETSDTVREQSSLFIRKNISIFFLHTCISCLVSLLRVSSWHHAHPSSRKGGRVAPTVARPVDYVTRSFE